MHIAAGRCRTQSLCCQASIWTFAELFLLPNTEPDWLQVVLKCMLLMTVMMNRWMFSARPKRTWQVAVKHDCVCVCVCVSQLIWWLFANSDSLLTSMIVALDHSHKRLIWSNVSWTLSKQIDFTLLFIVARIYNAVWIRMLGSIKSRRQKDWCSGSVVPEEDPWYTLVRVVHICMVKKFFL